MIRKSITPVLIIKLLFFIVFIPLLPLVISGNWTWLEGWVYAVIYTAGFVISRILAGKRHPDLITERAKFLDHEDTKEFDKILAPLLGIGGVLALITAGLDARFGWSTGFSPSLKILALAVILAGYALGSYALIENRFFSGTVRIQKERGQHVVSSGPYRWMRHPGYAGALLTYLGTPVYLDSWWTFLPVVFTASVIILRTSLEDKTLQEELPGYREYAGRVGCRLLPGIW